VQTGGDSYAPETRRSDKEKVICSNELDGQGEAAMSSTTPKLDPGIRSGETLEFDAALRSKIVGQA